MLVVAHYLTNLSVTLSVILVILVVPTTISRVRIVPLSSVPPAPSSATPMLRSWWVGSRVVLVWSTLTSSLSNSSSVVSTLTSKLAARPVQHLGHVHLPAHASLPGHCLRHHQHLLGLVQQIMT